MENGFSFGSGNITVHMIGVGGISMSGLAEILLHKGVSITGSDLHESEITDRLKTMGAVIRTGHSSDNISSQNLVVYTAAVATDNPELAEARRRGIPVMERAELLGAIMDQFQGSVAVSGTHGKTTTTSMISTVFIEAGLDPTVHVGGLLDRIGGNTRIGSSRWFVAEACEYKDSFLKFRPSMAVVLNIDADHLDYFRDIDHIRASFEAFISNVKNPGDIILNLDDPQTRLLSKTLTRPFTGYGINSPDSGWSCDDISFESGCASFAVKYRNSSWGRIKLSVPGLHNLSNALACIAAGHAAGIAQTAIIKGLESFKGTHRRLEDKGIRNGVRVMDDYAHHPTEIQASLSAARTLATGHLICVFQPHTYTRTLELLEDFSRSFGMADTVIVTDIYAAREKDTGAIHARTLAESINRNTGNAVYIKDFGDIARFLDENAQAGDVVITMGAGDIHRAGSLFLSSERE